MIEIPSSLKQNDLVDWAEASCLFGNRESISRAEVEQALENERVPDPEIAVSDIWLEISRRHRLADKAHPIKTLKERLERTTNWSDTVVYTFQLLLSSHYFYKATKISKPNWNKIAKLFEKLSNLALEKYLDGRAINIGTPRESGTPKGFRQCLDYLCKELGELRGDVESYNLPTMDEKVDAVAWRPFPDKRPGQIIIFAQCAAGKNWKDKAGEISFDLWRDYINWLVKPLIALTFPFVCLEDEEWRHISKQNRGLLLDRLRIASMFGPDDLSNPLLQEIKEWCEIQLTRLPQH